MSKIGWSDPKRSRGCGETPDETALASPVRRSSHMKVLCPFLTIYPNCLRDQRKQISDPDDPHALENGTFRAPQAAPFIPSFSNLLGTTGSSHLPRRTETVSSTPFRVALSRKWRNYRNGQFAPASNFPWSSSFHTASSAKLLPRLRVSVRVLPPTWLLVQRRQIISAVPRLLLFQHFFEWVEQEHLKFGGEWVLSLNPAQCLELRHRDSGLGILTSDSGPGSAGWISLSAPSSVTYSQRDAFTGDRDPSMVC